jgi:hypothetical protein
MEPEPKGDEAFAEQVRALHGDLQVAYEQIGALVEEMRQLTSADDPERSQESVNAQACELYARAVEIATRARDASFNLIGLEVWRS